MKLKNKGEQATTFSLEDLSEWIIEPAGTEVPDEVGQALLDKYAEHLKKVEE